MVGWIRRLVGMVVVLAVCAGCAAPADVPVTASPSVLAPTQRLTATPAFTATLTPAVVVPATLSPATVAPTRTEQPQLAFVPVPGRPTLLEFYEEG